MKDVSDIRITDPYIKKLVKAEQERSGERTATKTAARLILERITGKELAPPEGNQQRTPQPSAA